MAENASGQTDSAMQQTADNAQAAQGSKPAAPLENMNMNDLLAAYEDDLGITEENQAQESDFNEQSGATIAQEVNLLKQVSEQQM